MTTFEFILGSLATFNIALAVSKESGPFRMFERFRKFLKREAKENVAVRKSAIQEGIECFFCVSRYASLLVVIALLYLKWMVPIEAPLYWLAFSSVAIVINQQWTKGG